MTFFIEKIFSFFISPDSFFIRRDSFSKNNYSLNIFLRCSSGANRNIYESIMLLSLLLMFSYISSYGTMKFRNSGIKFISIGSV